MDTIDAAAAARVGRARDLEVAVLVLAEEDLRVAQGLVAVFV